MRKEVETTFLVYFIKCRPALLFNDFVKREQDAGFPRILVPSKVIPLLNDPAYISRYLSGNDASMWTIMRERNGSLTGFIQDLKETGEKALLFGDEQQIRFWEKEFLDAGVRIMRYDLGKNFEVSEKICYITKDKKIIPIEDEVVCMA